MKSGQSVWVLVFFILTGLVGLALIGLGGWMVFEPARFAAQGGAPTAVVPTYSPSYSNAVIITATLEPRLAPAPAGQPAATAAPGVTVQPSPFSGYTSTGIANVPWDACPGSYQSHLRVGDKAMVSLNPPLPNNVRDQAGASGKFLFAIQPGETVDIVEGPGCTSGWVWWLIKTKDGRSGWTAEGDGKDYWLVPAK
jgi:hypothetical protein